jgi:O-antigen ligase
MLFDHLQYPYALLALITLGLLFARPVAGVLLLAAIFPMDAWSPRLPVPGINTETVLLGVAFAMTLLRFGARLPPARFSGPVVGFILMMGVGFALAFPWARTVRMEGGDTAIWVIFKYWKSITFTGLLFFSTYWWVAQANDRRRMLEALSVGVFISSMAAFADLALGITPLGSGGRAAGLQIDPNSLACALGPSMFVSLYLAIFARDLPMPRRVFHGATYGLAFIALVLALSRGNYIALVAAHLVFFALVSRPLFFATIAAVVMLSTVAYPLLPTVVRERIEVTVSGGSGYRVAGANRVEASTAARLALLQVGVDMFEESPLWGHGLNFFYFHAGDYGAKYGALGMKDAHNLVVKVAVEMGLFGLVILAWLVWAVFRCGRLLWRSNSPEYAIGAVLLAAGTHVLVANLSTNAFLATKDISAYFWILYALSARAYVERLSVAEVAAAIPVVRGRWRRFSQRTAAAASQL